MKLTSIPSPRSRRGVGRDELRPRLARSQGESMETQTYANTVTTVRVMEGSTLKNQHMILNTFYIFQMKGRRQEQKIMQRLKLKTDNQNRF